TGCPRTTTTYSPLCTEPQTAHRTLQPPASPHWSTTAAWTTPLSMPVPTDAPAILGFPSAGGSAPLNGTRRAIGTTDGECEHDNPVAAVFETEPPAPLLPRRRGPRHLPLSERPNRSHLVAVFCRFGETPNPL